MNSCILIAKIIRSPELRYTQDTQTPIAQMLVEFDGLQSEDPPATLKVVGWGNMASEIQEKYAEGDRLVIEGRLAMNTIDRPEGFKEKRAELIASRIHSLGVSTGDAVSSSKPVSTSGPDKIVSLDSFQPKAQKSDLADVEVPLKTPSTETATVPIKTTPNPEDQNLDDIPF